jgi:hypothetical protein
VTAQPDTIAWKLTTNGSYSANSAYKIQFQGSYANHDWKRIWTAKVDGKCKLFGWLILQNRMWTADRIVKHGGDANSICVLCRTHPETALHMLARIPNKFGKASPLGQEQLSAGHPITATDG